MLKDFRDVHFGKIYGIDILGSLRLDVNDELFTVYDLTVVVGSYVNKRKMSVSFASDAEIKEWMIKAFYDMIEEIRNTQTRIDIPVNVFEEVEKWLLKRFITVLKK